MTRFCHFWLDRILENVPFTKMWEGQSVSLPEVSPQKTPPEWTTDVDWFLWLSYIHAFTEAHSLCRSGLRGPSFFFWGFILQEWSVFFRDYCLGFRVRVIWYRVVLRPLHGYETVETVWENPPNRKGRHFGLWWVHNTTQRWQKKKYFGSYWYCTLVSRSQQDLQKNGRMRVLWEQVWYMLFIIRGFLDLVYY
jgi:hypothetical protein